MHMQRLIADQAETQDQPAADSGIDGGAAGSGIITADPTQGTGSSAWQRAQRMAAEVNARQRRN